ncbi:tRNA modification GTPase MnmE [Polystyrenella longa]|uniref:tRNA modification GTPase MnmE n=1 Tax=Polystyrenella longa TaxID=2528007 RepID=A0A518CQ96_9PLAN|nr:tRNA uridine-5-carboxymethylaminomethyl(34) synthesis GTPase MnmE [Polystyrenella longa]QDU81398.1 tRNA modification GTPase MnmE [Polystyrenella longa]
MNLDLDETIAALSSPPGPGGRGVLRLSGPEVKRVLVETLELDQARLDQLTSATRLTSSLNLNTGLPLPCSVYYWPTVRSYTGQPAAELQLPGSPPLLEAALVKLFQNGARPARPGEFTLRSFLAGRLDLVQAEAVLGVIDADDQVELKAALEQLAGGISSRLNQLREDMIDLVSDMEAGLDFVDEDIEFISREDVIQRLQSAHEYVSQVLDQSSSRMTSHSRPRVILAGLPNAGKSTLLNALAGNEAALVSEIEGTTRDYISQTIQTNNMSFDLIDTAGWETPRQDLMDHAHQRRDELLKEADLVLWCTDLSQQKTRSDEVLNTYRSTFRKLLIIQTKRDLAADHQSQTSFTETETGSLPVTVHEPGDMKLLKKEVSRLLSEQGKHDHQFLGSTAARTENSLQKVKSALTQAIEAAEANWGDDMIAIDLHQAIDHLGEIVGAVYTDDLLDRIFSKFCIGK